MEKKKRPLKCADYHVAWICPLPDIELPPARRMLDVEHEPPSYNDGNNYRFGTVSGHAVVLASISKGLADNKNVARMTALLFNTFPNIKIVLLVGIGGGIPWPSPPDDPMQDVHLGDVVVGWPGDGKPAVVEHDRGRQKDDGFELLGTINRPSSQLLNALDMLCSDHDENKTQFEDHLARLRDEKYNHPGSEHDKLFQPHTPHVGEYGHDCTKCDPTQLFDRPGRTDDQVASFVFHRGRIASGNAVIQNGAERDKIRDRCGGVLCVEMEAAGVDANNAGCLVIRGISDYADAHKSDVWKNYAAGNAAAFARELLSKIPSGTTHEMEKVEGFIKEPAAWLVPFARNEDFVSRQKELEQLEQMFNSSEACHRAAIWGIGGCGKTAIALELAYRTKERQPNCAVLWIPAITRDGFEKEYRNLAVTLGITGITDPKTDVKQSIKTKLSQEDFGEWLMIIDNADDIDVLLSRPDGEPDADYLIDCLPESPKGSILFTTRTRSNAVKLVKKGSNIIQLSDMDEPQAREMLEKRIMNKDLLKNDTVVSDFLRALDFLPLALVQAVAYINEMDSSFAEYLQLLKESGGEANGLLSHDFEADGRYRETKHPVAATWSISFNLLKERHPLASQYLSLMACIARENVPYSLLPPFHSPLERAKAIGMLNSYAFITKRDQDDGASEGKTGQEEEGIESERETFFDVHQLIHLATRDWLKSLDTWKEAVDKAVSRLQEVLRVDLPTASRETRAAYAHHACQLLPQVSESATKELLTQQLVGYWKVHLHHEEMVSALRSISNSIFGAGIMPKEDLEDALTTNPIYRETAMTIERGRDLLRSLSGRRGSVEAGKIDKLAMAQLEQRRTKSC